MRELAVALVLLCASHLCAQDVVSVLVPVAVSRPTPGAYGTLWVSELWVHNGSANALLTPRDICAVPEGPCVGPVGVGQTMMYPAYNLVSPAGAVMLSIPAAARHEVRFSNRLFELSRHTQPIGVEIPTVFEDQYFSSSVRFIGISSSPADRVALRIYHPVRLGSGGAVRIEVTRADGSVIGTAVLPMQYFDDVIVPGYAAVHDIAAMFPVVQEVDRYDVVVTPLAPSGMKYYALASVTNNDSQQVLIISAQH